MVVHGQHVEPAVCLSELYDVFLLDIVRDTRVSDFFTKSLNQKKKNYLFLFLFFFAGGGGGGTSSV